MTKPTRIHIKVQFTLFSIDWMTDLLTDRQTDRQTDWLTSWLTALNLGSNGSKLRVSNQQEGVNTVLMRPFRQEAGGILVGPVCVSQPAIRLSWKLLRSDRVWFLCYNFLDIPDILWIDLHKFWRTMLLSINWTNQQPVVENFRIFFRLNN